MRFQAAVSVVEGKMTGRKILWWVTHGWGPWDGCYLHFRPLSTTTSGYIHVPTVSFKAARLVLWNVEGTLHARPCIVGQPMFYHASARLLGCNFQFAAYVCYLNKPEHVYQVSLLSFMWSMHIFRILIHWCCCPDVPCDNDILSSRKRDG